MNFIRHIAINRFQKILTPGIGNVTNVKLYCGAVYTVYVIVVFDVKPGGFWWRVVEFGNLSACLINHKYKVIASYKHTIHIGFDTVTISGSIPFHDVKGR